MNRSVSQIARALGADSSKVKKWAVLFKEYLKPAANPAKGTARIFCDSDFLVLAYVFYNWEDNPDLEAIKIGLNQEDHHEDIFRECLYLNTPWLQEPPVDLDETWNHGFLLNGGGVNEYLELARSYRQGAEALLESALKSGEPREWGYPVLFAYRHTLELYLKIIGEIEEPAHSLKRCVYLVERRHGQKFGSPAREWIFEFDNVDPFGTAFRYADDEARTLTWAEYWVDFVQFKFAMKQVFEMLDKAIRRTGATGKAARKKGTGKKRHNSGIK
jgi:hypothetical protein